MKKVIFSILLAACSLLSIQAFAQVTADFTISGNTDKCTNVNYQFTNTSTNATSFEWDFGDGFNSSSTNPNHSYFNGGSYVVTLTAYDDLNNASVKKIGVYVKETPNAFFGISTYEAVYPGDVIRFENYSNHGNSFSWDFGDGTSSTEINPKKSYSVTGDMDVTLTVLNGCYTPSTYSTTITIVDTNTVIPEADGYAFSSIICPNEEVGFYSYSSLYKYLVWDFGDGNTLQTEDEEVYHTYSSVGDYEVTLYAVWDENRKDSLKFNVSVSVTDMDMPYSYVAPMHYVGGNYVVSNCVGSDFELQGGLNDDLSTSYWRRHDGTVLPDQYTSVSYSAVGVYDIWYVVENRCGVKDSTLHQLQVFNGDTFESVMPNIIHDPNTVCPGETMSFSANYYQEPDVEYNWYIGNDVFLNTYSFDYTFSTTPATYEVKLVRIPQCGRTDSTIKSIVIDNQSIPNTDFYINYAPSRAACYLDTVRFVSYADEMNPLTHTWEFGDGNTSSLPSPVHVYGSTGYFTVLHHVTNSCGVTATYALSVYLEDNIKPLPRFSAYPMIACENEEVMFDNFTMDADSAVLDYGDGNIEVFTGGFFPHNFHQYAQAGTYTAKLYVYNRCGGDSGSVTIQVIPGPVGTIDGGDRLIETGSTVSFTKTTSGAIRHTWYRSYSEIDTTTADTLVMTFSNEGVYTIYLLTENETGCISIDSVHVTVSNDPVSVQALQVQENEMVLYPNPVQNVLHLAVNLESSALVSMQILDMSGKLIGQISEKNLEGGQHVLSTNMGQLPPGIYVCNVLINGTPTQHKVVKY